MPRPRKPYPPEFREQLVALVRAGRTPEDLAREFEPTVQSIQQLGGPGRSRCGPADRRPDHHRACRTDAAPSRESAAEARAGHLVKSRGLVCAGDRAEHEAIFGFMKANQATCPVRVMSRLLGVSASGFYAWANRPASARAVADISLTALIHAIHRRSGGAYGAPSIQAELADDHQRRVGTKRVARLMRAAGLRGLHPRRFVTTTVGDPAADRAVDQVDRQFAADGPDRLWVADITYVPTWAGFLYLAIVLDVWSRRIVGWAMAPHLKTELVLSALNMALAQRRPEAVIHHSDRGCQYTSYAFGKRCRDAGVMPSMGSTGDAYDNAMAESFFATLEREVLNRRRFQSQAEARLAVFQWLEGWYNPHRRHSSLGYLSPINYERRQLQQSA